MSSDTPQRLATMANQIARNLARDDDPVAATAAHISSFWTPAMIAMLQGADGVALDPLAREALGRV